MSKNAKGRGGKRSSQREFQQARGYQGWCGRCGKATYPTKAAAKKAIRAMKGRDGHLNAYACPNVEGAAEVWHVGHMPDIVVRGELDRSALRVTDWRLTERRQP